MGENLENFDEALSDRYLTYALSTITNRALPDVRDGLKPVHRRILYSMRRLKLFSSGGYRKSAKIVGEVMGNFHPHGDKAIYDSLVRMAQGFNLRYPLIDGQGNFGNVDGDNPAAQRYTEAKLSLISELMINGLDENSVNFKKNYDETDEEPEILPCSFPQLLANGSSGIAVGMATNIPPHNIIELLNALIFMIENPKCKFGDLMNFVKGPDFPTGGIIIDNKEQIYNVYENGRGAVRLRAKYHVENCSKRNWNIVITEIPYQVQKAKLIEKIADLLNQKKISFLSNIRDESDHDIRLILEPKSKNLNPDLIMENLFKLSDLEIKFSINMNVLIDGKYPKVCNLKEILKEYLSHRMNVLVRVTKFNLERVDKRLEILEGYLITFLNLEKVIEIIRFDKNPKKSLMISFDLTERQSEAILNMRLRSLRKLEEVELSSERETLLKKRTELDDILEFDDLKWKEIKKEITLLKKNFSTYGSISNRLTTFAELPSFDDLQINSLIEKEEITIILSKLGWIRTVKGHIPLDTDIRYKDGDKKRFVIHADKNDKLILSGENGRFYTISCSTLPSGRGMGEPIRLLIDFPNDLEVVSLDLFNESEEYLLASNMGNGFICDQLNMVASTRNGKEILKINKNEKLQFCIKIIGDHLAIVSKNRKLLIFNLNHLPKLKKGKGIRIQKLKNEKISDLITFSFDEGLKWKDSSNRLRKEPNFENWIGKRASVGKNAPKGFSKNNKFNLFKDRSY